MLKNLLIALLLCSAPLYAQNATNTPPLPKPREGGDYWLRNEDTWVDWEVTCPELVGRLTPAWPQDEEAADALLNIDWLVPQWPVIAKFAKGERVLALPDECGGILIKDIDGGTWMKVQARDGRFCFVRANGKYLKPVTAQRPAAVAPTSVPAIESMAPAAVTSASTQKP